MMNRLERLMEGLAAAALLGLMLIVLVDVIGRDVFNRPLAAGTELTELGMAFLAFVAFPLLALRQRDITVDLYDFIGGGGGGSKRYQVVLAGLVGTAVYGLLAWQMITFARRAAASGEATAQMGLPLGWVWWAMCILGALAAAASLAVTVAACTSHPIAPAAQEGTGQ
jgi:TRAP-type C4-dicarboxylate transport system permease small subunit